MTHHLHNDRDLLGTALPRRRVLLSFLGGTLTLAGLAGCGGEGDDEEDEEGAGAADQEETEGGAADEEAEEEEEDD